MYFQLVDNQVLSTQGEPDVFNLHRLYRVVGHDVERDGAAPAAAGREGVVDDFVVAEPVGVLLFYVPRLTHEEPVGQPPFLDEKGVGHAHARAALPEL